MSDHAVRVNYIIQLTVKCHICRVCSNAIGSIDNHSVCGIGSGVNTAVHSFFSDMITASTSIWININCDTISRGNVHC